MEAERQRIGAIIALCRQTGMEPDTYIQNEDSLDTVRAAAVEHLMKHGAPVSTGLRAGSARPAVEPVPPKDSGAGRKGRKI